MMESSRRRMKALYLWSCDSRTCSSSTVPRNLTRRHPSRCPPCLAPGSAPSTLKRECSDSWPVRTRHRTWLPSKRSATGWSERVAPRPGRGHLRRNCASFWTEPAVAFVPSTRRTATSSTAANRPPRPRLDPVLSPVPFLFRVLVLARVLVLFRAPAPAPAPGWPSSPPGFCSCSGTCNIPERRSPRSDRPC